MIIKIKKNYDYDVKMFIVKVGGVFKERGCLQNINTVLFFDFSLYLLNTEI